jgi:CcmD family protein
MIKKLSLSSFLFLTFICMPFLANGQASSIDFLRSTGKIYVVVAVICVILIGLFWFMFRLDKRLTKIENQIK